MRTTVETQYEAKFRDERGRMVAISYDEQFTALVNACAQMRDALDAADKAWDSAFSHRRSEARAQVHAALVAVRAAP